MLILQRIFLHCSHYKIKFSTKLNYFDDFKRCSTADYCLYKLIKNNVKTYLLIYVDDTL